LTPLAAAIRADNQQTVSRLLELGADIHAAGRGGETPLFLAAFFGRLEIVEYLLERGADVNAQTMDGRTPLHAAVLGSHPEVARRLMEAGAVISETDRSEQALIGTAYLYDYTAFRAVEEGDSGLARHYYQKAAYFYELCAVRFQAVAKKYTAKAMATLVLGAAYIAGSTYSAAYNATVGAEARGIGFGFIDYSPIFGAEIVVSKNMTVQGFYRDISKQCEEESVDCK
jgi:hypothetical protein